MELETTLTSQPVQTGIRAAGINPNYWYAVGWAKDLQPGQVMPVTLWQRAIALYRTAQGTLHALEDICPHRGVALHKGKVMGDHLACRYHGWEFDGTGHCVAIPYLPPTQKLPCAQTRPYPIQEKYGLLWIFGGNPELAVTCDPPEMPEFDQSGWLMIPVTGHFQAHFSICNENTMDVFHGVLHEDLQGWFDPVLLSLNASDESVCADYQVSYKGQMAKWLGLSDRADQVTTRSIQIEYRYPHYRSHLQGLSALYLMRLPVTPTESRSFALFFFKTPFPNWLVQATYPLLKRLIGRSLIQKFLAQDTDMIESEQRTHLHQPGRRYIEINPAIIAVQRLMLRQYEQSLQAQPLINGHKNRLNPVPWVRPE